VTRARLAGAVAAVALAAGCAAERIGPGDLELVRVDDAGAPPPPRPVIYRLVVESALDSGAVEDALRLPLPPSGPFQTVTSLLVELAPPGVHRIEEGPDGARSLVVTGPRPAVTLRVRIDRPRRPVAPELPAALQAIPAGLGPPEWVTAAREAGAEARLGCGLERRPGERAPRRLTWPEVRLGARWVPVDAAAGRADLPAGRVRLGPAWPSSDAGEPTTRYALSVDGA